MNQARIGIFGGSGFYALLDDVRQEKIETPYGPPSDMVALGEIVGVPVAFLPRHGRAHTIPPHAINYRANVWALRSLGVEAILAPSACGSLQPHLHPGDFVICDQFIDRTQGRKDTFYDGPIVTHVSAAEPYCPVLRTHAIATCRQQGVTVHERGTTVVVQGPRFSSKAESRWFTQMGWDVVNMTQYPECFLARELELPYVNLSVVTDYDAGLVADGAAEPVTAESAFATFEKSLETLRAVLFQMVETLPDLSESPARIALASARFV
jgi:5'-methylthioadenosine phosphorylase